MLNPSTQDPNVWGLFGIWASIGLQSFGGGASTSLHIQRAFIDQRRWLTMDDYLRLWNLCLLAPGINLIAITILLGKRFGGARGVVVSVAGLLLPSATITCLLAIGFSQITGLATIQAMIRGIIPATGGIMLMVGFNFARPFIRQWRTEGSLMVVLQICFILICALAIIVLDVPAIIVVFGAVLLGMLVFSPKSSKPSRER